MSASQWRRAMNTSAVAAVMRRPGSVSEPMARRGADGSTNTTAGGISAAPSAASWWSDVWRGLSVRQLLVLLALLVYPVVATPFFTYQIGVQSLALGIIALSLTFLAGYGGMVSLAQMSIAGMAGYLVAIFGSSSLSATISMGWPWPVAVLLAVTLATVFAALVGWLSVRTEGIYTIMITLAVGVAFFYLAQQNYTLFNGFQGFNKLFAPTVLGIDFRQPLPFYYLALACAVLAYGFVRALVGAPFGMALQGIRDNPRRMSSLGYNVTAHRVAAHAVAGLLAAIGGVLMVWYNNRISPGTMNTGAMINILIIAVLGGLRHPIGAFIGAILFVLLQNFAIDLVDRERFNLVIGGVFLAIVLFSPDGLLGLWATLRSRLVARPSLSSKPRRQQ
jgi:branched-chain amino acid transport system permease protein